MITSNQYINIREVLSRILRHPLMQDITLEQVIQYTLDFIGIFGLPAMYNNKEDIITIEDYRGILPCDLISINMIKDNKSGICLNHMSDVFNSKVSNGLAYKTQGNIIHTTFKEGELLISYRAIMTDKDGFPLLIDNPVFLRTLELYVKKEWFTILFDTNKINNQVYNNTLQQYSWSAGQLNSEFSIPSVAELESISNQWNSILINTREFNNGFATLKDKNIIKPQ